MIREVQFIETKPYRNSINRFINNYNVIELKQKKTIQEACNSKNVIRIM